MATFTVYRVWNDELSNKEHLDSWSEVEAWACSKGFGHIRVVRDHDGKTRDAMLTTEEVQTVDGPVWLDVYDWIS
ncbi:MAG: hypothetical protein IPM39_25880 [Chloroflexi bacterium]|nr:hypothetical protein [Chloroflexota bacterium]